MCSYYQPNPEERALVESMPTMWDELVLKSKNVDASLVVVKRKFTEVRTVSSVVECWPFRPKVQGLNTSPRRSRLC